jgi:hypothetical protein
VGKKVQGTDTDGFGHRGQQFIAEVIVSGQIPLRVLLLSLTANADISV